MVGLRRALSHPTNAPYKFTFPHHQLHAVQRLPRGDVQRLLVRSAKAAVARVFGRFQEGQLLPLAAEEVDAGCVLAPGRRDDHPVLRDSHAVDAAFLAEVVDHLPRADRTVLVERVCEKQPLPFASPLWSAT